MSDTTPTEPALVVTEQPEETAEEVFDVFETEKAESDYVVKTFDYGIAARQVYGKGLDLQVITDEEPKEEVEIPKLTNNVFNTIMNLSIGEVVSPEKASVSRSQSFKVPVLSPTPKKDDTGSSLRNASSVANALSGSSPSLTSLDDSAVSTTRQRIRQEDLRSRRSPNTSIRRVDRKKSLDRSDSRNARKLRTNDKNSEVPTRSRDSSGQVENSKGMKPSKSNPNIKSTGKNTPTVSK